MRALKYKLTCLALGSLIGCAAGVPGTGDGGNTCTTNMQCNDGLDCTVDSCRVDMTCGHVDTCGAGMTCRAGGCGVAGCTMDSQCDDMITCTIDSCAVGGVCDHVPVDSMCTPPQTCNATMGCVGPTGCGSAAECNDTFACTVDTCDASRMCQHTPIDAMCNVAAGEMCSTTRGCYVPMMCDDAAMCQDGNFCNGEERCTEFGCEDALAPPDCSEVDPCRINERCDTTQNRCVYDCDRMNAACGCPAPMDCSGRFMLSGPGLMFACGGGGLLCPPMVAGYDMTQATFVQRTLSLEITPTRIWSQGITMGTMTDSMSPFCPDFDAVFRNEGGCIEQYRLQGTFTDSDHFTATLTREYIDADGLSCALCSCPVGATPYMVTGTRIP